MDEKDLKYYPDRQKLYGAWRFFICIFFGVVAVITGMFVVPALCDIGGPIITDAARGLFFGIFLPYTVFSIFYCMWAKAFVRTLEYTVTDKALVIKQGVFQRIEKSIPFHKVTDALTIQGPVARLYGFGNVCIQTAGTGQGTEGTLRGLVNYKEVRNVILERVTTIQKQDRFGE